MSTYYADNTTTVLHGDSLQILPTLPDNSVDAVVTDPPYSLSFMQKSWDSHATPAQFQIWCQLWAAECLRILKPGGHMLAFGGTRTSHRLACAIEDAGFEIRDSIAWLYGSGFPKSLDVSKAIDRAAPRAGMFDAFAAHLRGRRLAKGLTLKEVAAPFPSKTGGRTGCAWNWENGANVPTPAQWAVLAEMLDMPQDMWQPLIDRVEAEREVLGTRPAIPGVAFTTTGPTELDVTAPATPEARQWQGWGTALKPAFEPIVVARRPLSEGSVAGNVLRYGTGALNIDCTRIAHDAKSAEWVEKWSGHAGHDSTLHEGGIGKQFGGSSAGRGPANVALDQSQAAALDQQSGESSSSAPNGRYGTHEDTGRNRTYGAGLSSATPHRPPIGDVGGASRFFHVSHDLPIDQLHERFRYTAKADSGERVSYWRLSCNCETVKPWQDTSPQRDIDDSKLTADTSWSTSTSGNNTTDEASPQDMTYTTETETSSTTTRPTSNSSPSLHTNGFTPAANFEMANGGSPAASVKSSNPSPLSTGTSALKAGPFTDGADPATLRGLSATSVCGRCGAKAKAESHATVKPLDLMRWLVRLVTPPGGLILDPFAGSGTTAEAALLEGFSCIAIEREQDYLPLITQRIHRRRNPVQYLTTAGEDLGLFGGDDA